MRSYCRHQLLLLVGLLLLLSNNGIVHGQERCGPNTCQANEVCCNESCGICAPSNDGGGVACTLQYCPSFLDACFSGTSTLTVLGKNQDEDANANEDSVGVNGPTTTTLMMKDLRVGDYVQTASGGYHQVYAFGHYDTKTPTKYLKISTSCGSALEVSHQHLIHVQDSTNPIIAARDVKVGDWLRSSYTTSTTDHCRVVEIQEVERIGMYAPFTTDGTLLVNGIVASSYISLDEYLDEIQPLQPWVKSHMAWLSHLALSPFRLYCTTFATCQSYNDEGISHYPALLLRFFQRTAQLEGTTAIFFSSIRWLIIGFYLLVATAFWMAGSCLTSYVLTMILLVSAFVCLCCHSHQTTTSTGKKSGLPQ